ncbi:hypothetical protein CGCF413_v008829 [Colletotrichum fructicola]|nr:hypothetical protein CGCF413_v008829 [Colletotrichum fructicola]
MVDGDGHGDGNRDGAARVWIVGQISLTWDPHALLTAFGGGGSLAQRSTYICGSMMRTGFPFCPVASAANGRRAFSIARSDQPALRNFYQFAVTAEVETCQISYLQARFRSLAPKSKHRLPSIGQDGVSDGVGSKRAVSHDSPNGNRAGPSVR